MSPLIADNAILAGLWNYWLEKCAQRPMPSRRDIDPTEVPKLLENLQLVERIGVRYFYRLTGAAIVEAYGFNLTGKFVDDVISGHRRKMAEQHYALVYTKCRPIFVRNRYMTERGMELVSTRIILPLSEDGISVNMLLIAQTFTSAIDYAEMLGKGPDVTLTVDAMEYL